MSPALTFSKSNRYSTEEEYEKYDFPEKQPVKCEMFYGSVTVGERGQIVIPAEARNELGIESGDKLLVMRHPVHQGLMVCKFEAMKEFLEELEHSLGKVKEHLEVNTQ